MPNHLTHLMVATVVADVLSVMPAITRVTPAREDGIALLNVPSDGVQLLNPSSGEPSREDQSSQTRVKNPIAQLLSRLGDQSSIATPDDPYYPFKPPQVPTTHRSGYNQ